MAQLAWAGDTININVAVTEDGVPLDLTGLGVVWEGYLSPYEDAPLIAKTTNGGGIAITDAPGGLFRVTLTPADTSAITDNAPIYWRAYIMQGQNVYTVVSGILFLRVGVR